MDPVQNWQVMCVPADDADKAAAPECPRLHVNGRWLVGLSYRVVYLRDPVPSNKGKTGLFTDAMQHVHGEIYIDNARVQPGAQPSDHTFNKNDHIWAKYLEVKLTLPSVDSYKLDHKFTEYCRAG